MMCKHVSGHFICSPFKFILPYCTLRESSAHVCMCVWGGESVCVTPMVHATYVTSNTREHNLAHIRKLDPFGDLSLHETSGHVVQRRVRDGTKHIQAFLANLSNVCSHVLVLNCPIIIYAHICLTILPVLRSKWAWPFRGWG